MKYREDKYKKRDMANDSSKYEVGCVKKAKEERQEMLGNGGGKYSYDNPMELQQRSDKLAKSVK